MNIVIPLGGKGERFKNEDYNLPKVLTPVFGKKIISWVIESFKLNKNDCFTIIYNNHLDQYKLEEDFLRIFYIIANNIYYIHIYILYQ